MHARIAKQGAGQGQGVSDGWYGSISTVGPSFNISDETQRERPLLCFSLFPLSTQPFPLSSLIFLSSPFPPLFGPIIFLFAPLLLLSVSPLFLYIVRYNFPSSFRIISRTSLWPLLPFLPRAVYALSALSALSAFPSTKRPSPSASTHLSTYMPACLPACPWVEL